MGLNSWFKVQTSSHMQSQTSLAMEEHESTKALDTVGQSESNSSSTVSTCCSSSSSTMLGRLCVPTPSPLVRKQTIGVNSVPPIGKINYKNNRGLFWELENRIMGGERIMC